jgi:hypothetical protein
LSSPWSPNRSPSTNTQTRTLASGIRDEWREGADGSGKEIVKRVWEVVRLYWHMGSTPAQNSYCTPTSLSAKEIPLDQCWAVLTFVRTGRFRFLRYVMRTWSRSNLYMCVCVCVCVCVFELVRTDRVFKIFIFSKVICFSNMVILAYTITIDFPIRFSELSFHSFWKLIVNFFYYYLLLLLLKIIFFTFNFILKYMVIWGKNNSKFTTPQLCPF